MIRYLARLSVNNAVAVNLAMACVFLAGALAYVEMPREVFPEFSLETVRVQTLYPGAAPEDVERLVSLPLEDELLGLDGLKELSSRSQEGLSAITLKVEEGADLRQFLDDVRVAADRVEEELPDEVEDVLVEEVKTEWPAIAVFVYGHANELELREVAERHKRELESIPGVSQVILSGAREPRVWVEVDPLALERYDLTLDAIGRAVSGRAVDRPLGSLTTASGEFLLRVSSEVEGAAELLDLPVIARPDGAVVRLSQVARVRDTFERPITLARFNAQPCMHLQVNKASSGDAVSISRDVHEYVATVRDRMPEGLAIGTNSDLSIYIKNRLRVMRDSALLGGALVLVSLILFLNVRVAAMTALGIPFSFLGGLFLAHSMGISMNMMTMFALIVVLGMLVDDAIVVGENIYRRMEEGLSPAEAAVEGTVEVGRPVTATILTTVAAFLPILLVGGTTGNFMRPLPILVSVCLVVSLVEAVTILPAHLAHWSGRRLPSKPSAGRKRSGRWYDPARRAYTRFLAVALRWRYVTLAAAGVTATVLFAFAYHRIPFNLFDDFESKVFYVNLRTPSGASLEETTAYTERIEERILEMPREELESANMLAGISFVDAAQFTVGENLSQVWVELREGGEGRRPTADIIEELRAAFADPPEGIESVEIAQPQAGPTGRAIDLAVRGPELEVLTGIADEIQARLATFAGVRDVRDNVQEGKREVRFRMTEAGRTLGFTEAGLAAELRAAFEGTTFARLRRGNDDVEVVVKLPEELRDRRGTLEALRVSAPDGTRVPLGVAAHLVETTGQPVITRDDGRRSVRVTADINKEEGNAAAVADVLRDEFADLGRRYPGYDLVFKGDDQETRESFEGLLQSLVVALAVIYFILGALFRSTLQPFVIMMAIPFGGVGMILGHLAMGRDISLMSLIGLLALSGIVVNDSLIFVEFVNAARRKGRSLIEALLYAGELRFRPIVLTSITTMLGLSPLTFFASGQARFLQPMAITIFFGIALATGMILVLIPCFYAVLEDLVALARSPVHVARRVVRDRPVHPAEAAS